MGCGQGASSWFLSREGFSVIAADGSITALRKVQERLSSDRLPITTVACCATQLPFQNHSFDAVVDVVASAHNDYRDLIKIFREVARVLKPDGRLFSMMPTNRCSRRPFQGKGAISFMELWEIEELLQRDFKGIEALPTSYHLDAGCKVENWVITASRAAA